MSLTTSTQRAASTSASASASTLKMPSSSSSSSSPAPKDSGLDGVLPLSYKVLSQDADKQTALRLVADSIAQQRQTASAAVIFHPLCVAAFVAACSVAHRHYRHQGYGTLLTMLCGVTIIYLATVRFYTSQYIKLAEAFRWRTWLRAAAKKEDTVIVAVFGEEIIGTLVLRLQPPPSATHRGNNDGNDSNEGNEGSSGKGVIRAWTTKLRYRRKGVGSDLLHFAVQATREAFGPSASVEFAADHANSVNPLADMFNRVFERRQERAEKALEHALLESRAAER